MSDEWSDTAQSGRCNWYDGAKLFQTFRLARSWRKISLALVALVLTLIWGSVIDRIWIGTGYGVEENAFRATSDVPDKEAPVTQVTDEEAEEEEEGAEPAEVEDYPERGVFAEFSGYCRSQVVCTLSPLHKNRESANELADIWVSAGNLCNASRLLVRNHPGFCVVFFPGFLVIWAMFGGMICRIAAVEFARGEVITTSEAFAFVRKRFWSGFVLAPMAPFLWIVFCAILLVISGWIFSIPFVGNTLGALLFGLALLAGLAGAVLVVGFVAGGSLLWPTIAVEGTTAFDAFSTSFHYVYTRPWRGAFYALIAFVYGAVCFVVVHLFAHLTLYFTHTFVSAGTFATRMNYSKLDAIWTYSGANSRVHQWQPEAVGGLDYLAVILIGFWVYFVIALVWAYLASYYYSACTVIYFLLRRAVDLTDYERVEEIEDYEQDELPTGDTGVAADEEAAAPIAEKPSETPTAPPPAAPPPAAPPDPPAEPVEPPPATPFGDEGGDAKPDGGDVGSDDREGS